MITYTYMRITEIQNTDCEMLPGKYKSQTVLAFKTEENAKG